MIPKVDSEFFIPPRSLKLAATRQIAVQNSPLAPAQDLASQSACTSKTVSGLALWFLEMVLEGLLTNVLTERTAASVMHRVIADTESRPDRSRANR